jgi:serine protease Do
MDRDGWRRRDVLAALAATSAAGTAGCADAVTRNEGDEPSENESEAADAGADDEAEPEERYARLYEEIVDSVVLIQTAGDVDEGGQGTGFVHDGRLLTNQHITRGAGSVDVQFSRNDWAEASVIGEDVYADLAVLEVPELPDYASDLAFVGETPRVGTEVVALGNPFGLAASVSSGIVSGVNRSIQSPTGVSIPDGIQTDAAVNPGNSGGPLVTLDGEVAGVISAGGGDNIAFAISAALARRVVPDLVETGSYDHPYLGLQTFPVDPEIAEANDLPDLAGVYVYEVAPDGPAADVLEGSTETGAGGAPTGGDVLVELAGFAIETDSELSSVLALELSPGDEVEATIRRDGEDGTVELTVGTRPEP